MSNINDGPLLKSQIMQLVEHEISLWTDDVPPRHALSALWGKIRDMPIIPKVTTQ